MASASIDSRMCFLHRLRRLTSYLKRERERRLMSKRTPEQGQLASLQTLCQKLAFDLSIDAALFQPGITRPCPERGRVSSAETFKVLQRESQYDSSTRR